MFKPVMNLTKQTAARIPAKAKALLALGVLAASLSGCVVYPNGAVGPYAYAAPAPVYVAPPPVVVGFGWGGGWGGGWGHRGWR